MSLLDGVSELPLLAGNPSRYTEDGLLAFVKIYNPNGKERWYISAYNPYVTASPCFGLQILADEVRSFGYFFLEELELYGGYDSSKKLQRDTNFTPRTLEECL